MVSAVKSQSVTRTIYINCVSFIDCIISNDQVYSGSDAVCICGSCLECNGFHWEEEHQEMYSVLNNILQR